MELSKEAMEMLAKMISDWAMQDSIAINAHVDKDQEQYAIAKNKYDRLSEDIAEHVYKHHDALQAFYQAHSESEAGS